MLILHRTENLIKEVIFEFHIIKRQYCSFTKKKKELLITLKFIRYGNTFNGHFSVYAYMENDVFSGVSK